MPATRPQTPHQGLLFWATSLVPAGVIAIGILASIYPRLASVAFGIPVADSNISGYVRIAGVRDIFFGLAILALLLEGDRRATAIVFAIVTLIPVCDGLVVLNYAGFVLPLLMHWGAAVYMSVVAYFLLSTSQQKR